MVTRVSSSVHVSSNDVNSIDYRDSLSKNGWPLLSL